VAIAAGFALRLLAYRRGWRLPRGLDWQPRRMIMPRATRTAEPDERREQG
jgi:hypothetical protein